MTAHRTPSISLRDVARWWPLILVPVVLAVGAAAWSAGQQTENYTASTRLVVVPLAQWDETFLGTSLIRDAGDAKSTATTVAALLDTPRQAGVAAEYLGGDWSPASVDAAVKVAVLPESNVIEVQAHSVDARLAEQLSEGFAKAALADRWKTISAELDTRIAALSVTTSADPNSGEASTRLQTLTVIRQSGSDPTLRSDSTAKAVPDDRLPIAAVIAAAAVGGLFVGVLCAVGMARLRSKPADPAPDGEE